MRSCSRVLRCLYLTLLFGVGVQAQTSVPVDASPLPQLQGDTLGLGPVDIELISAPGVAIVEDHQGYMWFGGSTGLARYDRHNLTLYQHEPGDSTSLPISRVESLHVDREGTLWVGTYGGGLNRYDPDTDSFLHYRHDPDDPASLSQDTVTVILEDRQGALWVGTGSPELSETPADEGGLNRFDPTTGTFTRYRHDPDDPASLIHNKVMSIYEDRRGRFFVGTLGDGLHTMDREAGTFTRHRTDPDDPSELSRPFREDVEEVEGCTGWECGGVPFIHEDDRGRYWIGGFGIGVDRYDPDTGARSRHDLASAAIWSVFESSDGTLWVGTWGGVHKLITSENMFRHVAQDPTDPRSLGGNYITDLLEDEEGHLWVSFSEPNSLQPSGVDRLDSSTGTFTHFRYDPDDAGGLAAGEVWDIYEDRSGMLWIGRSPGLSRYDRATGRFTHFQHDPNDPASLSAQSINAQLEDHRGRFWVGTWGGGLDLLNRETGRVTHHRHDPDNPTSLSNNIIVILYEDEAGTVWVGTQTGLSRLVEGNPVSFETHFPNAMISSIHEDRQGRFWVGTWGEGLYRFDRETGEHTRFGPERGLPSVNVGGILEDDDGYLWFSTAEGLIYEPGQGRLARFDPEEEHVINFGEQEGLPEVGFHRNSALKSRDGRLLFGGLGGYIVFDPADMNIQRRPAKVVLSGLRVFNEEVAPGPEAPLQQSIHLADAVRLTHAQNDFTVDCTALAYRNPGQVQYQYRLDPYDADWVNARSQRSARYSGVDPGSYVFRVRAFDSRG